MNVNKDGTQVELNVYHVQIEIVIVVIPKQDIVSKKRVIMEQHLKMDFVLNVMQHIVLNVIHSLS